MNRWIPAFLLLAALLCLTACEDEEKIADLERQRDDLKQEGAALEGDLAGVESELEELRTFPEVQALETPSEEGGDDAE